MKVAFVTPMYYPETRFGGPPVKIHALASKLIERGLDVRVTTFDSQAPRRREVRVIGEVPVSYLPWIGRGFRQVPLAQRYLRQEIENADLVHVFGLYTFLAPIACRLARRARRPIVMEPLGMYEPRARNVRFKRWYHRLFTGGMFRDASCVVATSEQERRELSRAVNSHKILLRGNGLDIAQFRDLPSGALFRDLAGLLPKDRVILFLGRMSPVKNLEQLVEAFATLSPPDCRLILVGPAAEKDYLATLHQTIRRRRLGDNVRILGELVGREKLSALAAAELFVMPSLVESFGNAVAEAVAAGVPVLVTETCGIAPLVHGRAGLAVPVGVEALADGMRVMLSKERRRELTSKREEVLTELSWDKPVQEMESAYQRLLASEPDTVMPKQA